MKLWNKIIVMSVATTVGIIALLALGSSYFFGRNFTKIETESMVQNLDRINGAVNYKLSHLNEFATDWAQWDDSYQFIMDVNQRYIDVDLAPQSFYNLKTNIIAYLDTSGTIVWAKCYDLRTENEIPLPLI